MPKMICMCMLQMMILISLVRAIRRKTFHIKFYDTLSDGRCASGSMTVSSR